MQDITTDQIKQIKLTIAQSKALEKTISDILNSNTMESSRYTSYKMMARFYNDLATQAVNANIVGGIYSFTDVESLPSPGDMIWSHQKAFMESILVNTRMLITTLESNIDYVTEERENTENFLQNKLRSVIFESPNKEKDIQNGIETIFIGKGYRKGLDYDRETGKFNYSGREYIPDFILPKMRMCIEVKLLKDLTHKSKMIEEINADIPAYLKNYENILFVIYDLGNIRDETEFMRDIENNIGVNIIVVKH